MQMGATGNRGDRVAASSTDGVPGLDVPPASASCSHSMPLLYLIITEAEPWPTGQVAVVVSRKNWGKNGRLKMKCGGKEEDGLLIYLKRSEIKTIFTQLIG